ncbi:MAG: hypothetical protein DME99_08935 [Verrucomicrobia bacterium]|nr:MAG: hypothetical protein DME99_08935 [Verrucomicrobiota bacterium]
MRGVYELNVRGLKLVGLELTCGAIDVFAIGLAAGATRLVAARAAPFGALSTVVCPAAMRTPTEDISATTKQNAENLNCFISCSMN